MTHLRRRPVLRTPPLLSGLLFVLAAAPVPAQETATVLHGGRVFTADPGSPWAEAVAFRGDRIVAVGTDAEVLRQAGEGASRIDLEGRLVIPGLNDAHLHVGAGPQSVFLEESAEGGIMADPDWSDLLEAVEEAAASAPEDTWIRGTIGPAVLADPSATRFALDSVAPEHPVMLIAASGHGTLVNTNALEVLDLPLDPAPLPGGWYERRAEDDAFTGKLREAAEVLARRRLSSIQGTAANAGAYRRAAEALLGWGVTSVQQHAASLPLEEAAAALNEADVPVRWSLYRWPLPRHGVEEAWPAPRVDPGPRVRVRGVKWMLDGTPLEHGMAVREPYADRPGSRGRLNFSPDQIRAILAGALEHDEQLALHVGGDRTLAVVLDAMAELGGPEVWRDQRVRIEHGDGLMSDLLPRAAELGVVLVQNPLHFTVPIFAGRLGADRARQYQPLRSAVEAGIPVALGADAGDPAWNPFLNIMLAVRHPSNPPEALTLEQALTAYTRGSAYAEGAEDEKGVLAPGMLADLAVLSQDIFSVSLDELPATRSVLTIVGGEVAHRDGPPAPDAPAS